MTRRPEERGNHHQGFTYQTPSPARQYLDHEITKDGPSYAFRQATGYLNQVALADQSALTRPRCAH
jgi:hypothetical protein